MTTSAETFDQAANLIAEHGLNQKEYWPGYPEPWPGNQPCCIFGALMVVTGGIDDATQCAQDAGLYQRIGEPCAIVDWNDKPARTAQDVITVLRACAAALREEAT